MNELQEAEAALCQNKDWDKVLKEMAAKHLLSLLRDNNMSPSKDLLALAGESKDHDDECDDDEDMEEGDKKGKKPMADDDMEDSDSKEKKNWQYPHKFSCWEEVEKAVGQNINFDDKNKCFVFHYDAGVNAAPTAKQYPHLDLAFAKAAFGEKAGSNEDFRPTKSEMQKILQFTGRKNFTEKDFKVFYYYAADDQIDAHHTHFSLKGLREQAADAPDNPSIKGHNYRNDDGVYGKIFDSKVEKGPDGITRLFLKVYIRDKQSNQDIIDGFEDGTNNKLSVGLSVERKDFICDICEEPFFGHDYEWCGHYPGWEVKVKDSKDPIVCTGTINGCKRFLEISRVTVPAQKYARAGDVPNNKSEDLQLAYSLGLRGDMSETLSKAYSLKSVDEAKEFLFGDPAKKEEVTQENSDKQGSVDTIPVDSKKSTGETTVSEETQKDAAQQGDTTSTAAEIVNLSQYAETLQSVSKANEEQITALKSLVEELKKSNDDQKAAAEAVAKANAERIEVLEKQVTETRELFSVVAAAQKDLAQKCNALVGKSMEQLERTLAHVKDHKTDRISQEKAKQAEAEQAWTGAADRFF